MRIFTAAFLSVALFIALGSCNNAAPATAQDPATLVTAASGKLVDIKSSSFVESISVVSQDKSASLRLSYSGALAEGGRVFFTETDMNGRKTEFYQRDETNVAAKTITDSMWNPSSEQIEVLKGRANFLGVFAVLATAANVAGQTMEVADGLSCQKVTFEVPIADISTALGTTMPAEVAVEKPASGYVLISPVDGLPRKLVLSWESKALDDISITSIELALSGVNKAQSFPSDAEVFPDLVSSEAVDASATDATAPAADAPADAPAADAPAADAPAADATTP